ncbi:MAG: beta-galactosidase [Anaerolineae bacterium]|nr:beta-galactosidase [Anaerolineae bacterium]
MSNYFQTVSPPYFTADFDYFRIAREKWELMLTRLKQMGINTLTLTTPWGFHENEGGTIDLHGTTNPRRNVVGLIQLCKELQFYCVIKLGPYHQNHGLLNQGLPTWLAEGSLPEAVQGWYKALSHALTPYQWPDGPIVALYFDSTPTHGKFPFPLDEHLIEVKWPIWLRKQYGNVAALNGAYGTSYSSISQAVFPTVWSQESTPVEIDAKIFLNQESQARQTHDYQTLIEAGWQVPLHPSVPETPAAPHIQNVTSFELPEANDAPSTIFNLHQPIQIYYDPVEIGSHPMWATAAPIRADGSFRRKFWSLRHLLWQHKAIEGVQFDGTILTIEFKGGRVVMSGQDTRLKIDLPKDFGKLICYRLRSTGELMVDSQLKISRGKLSGSYQIEDEVAQTDMLVCMVDMQTPLPNFLSTYLNFLLDAQLQTLLKCKDLMEALHELLSSKLNVASEPSHQKEPYSSYTLKEARRGLKDADMALRKAIRSIGGLESGFDSILGRPTPEAPRPAKGSLVINPRVFDNDVRKILYTIGDTCGQAAAELTAVINSLSAKGTIENLTIEHYQQSYAQIVTAAIHAYQEIDPLVAQLRINIATEKLPLVTWRIHDQIESIGKRLQWGILRS